MTSDQWRRLRDLFEQLVDCPESQREQLLAQLPGVDATLRQEVMSLLDHHSRAGSFLLPAVADRIPDLVADDEAALHAGTAIGPYTIRREIGRGGMGRVYLADDTRLGRTVALKALPPSLTGDAMLRERLRREARAAAALTHPGICTVYALEEVNGELFIATEYVDGHTLREEIDGRAPISGRQVRETAIELASALASAHAKGVVHRDLKPENIMRTREGRLKILDFGLARIDAPQTTIPSFPSMRTMPGFLIGTPAYMAPEQLNGEPADARVDVFAFGVVLYELACGTHPFEAATPLARVARVLDSQAQPISSRCVDLPARVATVIDRCLQKRPADRFPSAVDLALALTTGSADPSLERQGSASWWRAHQVVTIALYAVASTIAWRIKEFVPSPASKWLFVAAGVGSAIAGIVRGHLVFTEWMNRRRLAEERRRTERLTLVVDLMLAACLLGEGLLLAPTRPLYSVLTIALALGIAMARVLMEPATTEAVFGTNE